MKQQRRSVFDDPELTELFGDDPEALKLLDAVARVGVARQARRRARARAAALVAICAIGVLVVAVITTGSSKAGVIEKARRAFGTDAVVRVTLVDERAAATILDPTTGHSLPLHHVIDEWYDSSHQVRRVKDSLNGVVITDAQSHASTGSSIDAFAANYRAALRDRTLTAAGSGRVIGRSVYWLSFRKGVPGPSRVGVDQVTFRPAVVEYGSGDAVRRFRVIRALALKHATATPRPHPVRTLAAAPVRTSEPTSVPTALAELAPTKIPLRFRGLTLIRARRLSTAKGDAVQLFYEPASQQSPRSPYLRIIVSSRPLRSAGWQAVHLATPRGKLYLETSVARGFVHVAHTKYLAITASEPSLIVSGWRLLTK